MVAVPLQFPVPAVRVSPTSGFPENPPSAVFRAGIGVELDGSVPLTTQWHGTLYMYEYARPSGTCDATTALATKFLGTFSLPAGQTVDEQLTTPQIVKPLSASPYWCLVTVATGTTGLCATPGYGSCPRIQAHARARGPPACS
jgi:hypothetical protein